MIRGTQNMQISSKMSNDMAWMNARARGNFLRIVSLQRAYDEPGNEIVKSQ